MTLVAACGYLLLLPLPGTKTSGMCRLVHLVRSSVSALEFVPFFFVPAASEEA